MKDKTLGALIKLALCPGSPYESEICSKCSCQSDSEKTCVEKLKESCHSVLIEADQPEGKFPQSTPVDLTQRVTELLINIGFPAHLKGYNYLRKAIILAVENADLIDGITKVLYPELAKEFNTTPSRVERAIRHAIEVAWDRGDLEVLGYYFGNSVSRNKGKPTNTEFIAIIADRIRLELRTST